MSKAYDYIDNFTLLDNFDGIRGIPHLSLFPSRKHKLVQISIRIIRKSIIEFPKDPFLI